MSSDDKNKFSEIKKYMSIAASALLVIIASILFFFAVYRFSTIAETIGRILDMLQPFLFGLLFAYILNPLMMRYEKIYKGLIKKFAGSAKKAALPRKKPKKFNPERLSRGVAVSAAMITGIAVIYILVWMVVPELAKSITSLAMDLPSKIDVISRKLYEYAGQNESIAQLINSAITTATKSYDDWVNTASSFEFTDVANILGRLNDWFGFVAVGVKGVTSTVFNILIGLIVAIYVLNSKEKFIGQIKKILYSLFSTERTNSILIIARKSNEIFGGFIIGKLIDSAIVGVLCFIGMSILRLPYSVLISTIIGITNIIPFFGPYIGAIPSIILLLLSNFMQGIYFTIFIIVLQQIDGNIIGPKILGNSTGLSAFWVMFAIIVGGGLFGIWGMLFGVPVLSLIFYIFETLINNRIKKKSLPSQSSEYTDIDVIEVSDGSPDIVYLAKKDEKPVIDENKVPKIKLRRKK